MAELTNADLEAANRRGEIEMATKPRALSARYEPVNDRIVLELANGSTFAFPPRLLQGLEHAALEEIADIAISPSGLGLHWERLDADFTVAGLLAGRFGTRRYMVERFGVEWDAAAA